MPPIINKRFKNTKLLVCGSSKSIGKTDGYVKQIRKKACDGVVFVGQIYNDDLYKYYQLSDCQIIPSKLNEAFGLIALEGVASGLQVFTTKQGALPEVLNNYAEWLDVNNLEESIENSMLKVIKNNEKPSLKIETSEKILSIFSQKNYFENLYSSIHQIRCDNKNQSIKNINIIMRNNDGNKNAGYKANDDILKFLSNSYSNINRYIVRENKSGIIQLFLDLLKLIRNA